MVHKFYQSSIVLWVVALLLSVKVATGQEQVTVEPVGAFAEIETAETLRSMETLLGDPSEERDELIRAMLASPEQYSPPALYALSRTLFDSGDQEAGSFWFYAAQLRGQFDANRCVDPTARQALVVLDQRFGGPINQHMVENLGRLKKLIPEVIEWNRKTPHDYDHRWINLHGMEAVMASLSDGTDTEKPLSAPEDEWPEIAEQTRQDYLNAFNTAIESLEKQ